MAFEQCVMNARRRQPGVGARRGQVATIMSRFAVRSGPRSSNQIVDEQIVVKIAFLPALLK